MNRTLFDEMKAPPIPGQGNLVRAGDCPAPAPRLSLAKLRATAAVASVKRKAERDTPGFVRLACECMMRHLRARGRLSAEQLTDACIAEGIRAADLRAFGAPIAKLRKDNQIRVVDYVKRNRGHRTNGNPVYEPVTQKGNGEPCPSE